MIHNNFELYLLLSNIVDYHMELDEHQNQISIKFIPTV